MKGTRFSSTQSKIKAVFSKSVPVPKIWEGITYAWKASQSSLRALLEVRVFQYLLC